MFIADFELDSPILLAACRNAPETTITYQEVYMKDDDIQYIFWAETADFDAFDAALADDPTVTDPTRLAETPTQRLYRVRFTELGDEVATFPVWSELDLVLFDSTATSDGWEIRMGFPDREAIKRYRERCRENDLGFDPQSLYVEMEASDRADAAITPAQREALSAALEAGYFDVPRGTSLIELSDRLGISDNALSERLRRGEEALVRIFMEDT